MATYQACVISKPTSKIHVEFEVPDEIAGTADPEIKRRAVAAGFNAQHAQDAENSGPINQTLSYTVRDLKPVGS